MFEETGNRMSEVDEEDEDDEEDNEELLLLTQVQL